MDDRSTPHTNRTETMGAFDAKYTADQKEAAIYAYVDRRIRPLSAVVDLAARGELTTTDGRKARPFDLNPHTLKSWAQTTKRRRQSRIRGEVFTDPDDAIEALKRRMLTVIDTELTHLERQRTGKRDPELMRQIARAAREVAALPNKGEGRSRQPGANENGKQHEPTTQGGLAGSLLAAHRKTPAPEPPNPQDSKAETENARNTTVQTHASTETNQDTEPAHPVRSIAASLAPARTQTAARSWAPERL